MPFRGLINDKLVVPSMVPDHQPVTCPECDGQMYPRESEERARHFYHVAEDATQTCPRATGESDTHARCTALAAAALNREFGEQAVRYGVEHVVLVPNTPTDPTYRRADSFLEFESKHAKYGRGLIIEVQHKNHTKDLQGTTYDYLSAGYSVAWLTPADFEKERLDFTVVQQAFQAENGGGVRHSGSRSVGIQSASRGSFTLGPAQSHRTRQQRT